MVMKKVQYLILNYLSNTIQYRLLIIVYYELSIIKKKELQRRLNFSAARFIYDNIKIKILHCLFLLL
jgi:hypothetical protein